MRLTMGRGQVRDLFTAYDSDSDNSLGLNELAALLEKVGNQITALPAVRPSLSAGILRGCSDGYADTGAVQTAQVASQQGKYLGKKLTKLAKQADTLEANGMPKESQDEAVAKPFRYTHLGCVASPSIPFSPGTHCRRGIVCGRAIALAFASLLRLCCAALGPDNAERLC